ncbi:hypothetical protein B0H10DRAFT_497921 [Mycena sp. CBHHK59/15]|nr:hypothetical protein B0H10DRAFT_497921 [Mycena sp. CBHHK59/15]
MTCISSTCAFLYPGRLLSDCLLNSWQGSATSNQSSILLTMRIVDYLVPLFLGLLPNSMSSLTTLSLWGNKHDEWVIGGLYALRFPHLRSLTLDMWDSESHPPSGFNDFISAHHHNLELLNLEYSRWDSIALLLDERMGLGPDFLPTLRAFRGHSRNVEMMANTDMACLSNLTKLGVGAGGIYGPLDALNQMFGAIRTHLPLGRMSCLKELHFDIHGWRSNDENDILAFRYEIPTFIQRWGEICGPTLDLARLAAPRVVVVGRRTGRSTRPVSQAAGN